MTTNLNLYRATSDGWKMSGAGAGGVIPPPPVLGMQFGFNILASLGSPNTGYNPAGETTAQAVTRLVGDYGYFDDGKYFYSNFVPATYNLAAEGKGPGTKISVCMTWTLGSIASGSHDSLLTTYCRSIPAGKTVRFMWNEADLAILNGNIGNAALYKSDMDYLYGFVNTLSGMAAGAKAEVWDCFTEFTLSNATFVNTWTTPAKRHGYMWDMYWNDYTISTDPNTKLGHVTSKMAELGKTRWIIGECGDRRDQAGLTDSMRATIWQTKFNAMMALDMAPESCSYFNMIGTTGDHRVLTGTLGSDTLTKANLAGFIARARGE